MLERFNAFITDNNLCKKSDKLLLAVSGGMDSVVMAYLFQQAGFEFSIAHCNFRLRDMESEDDETFVKMLSKKIFKTAFFVAHFETQKFAEENRLSIQQSARELRYLWFEKIRIANKLSYIATAHHSDDNLETFFINLIRGTGITGLAGIPLKQNQIIRPMLFATCSEIENYARENHIPFREDSSNLNNKYLRNSIRHNLFPVLEKIKPSYRETISQTIQNLKGTEIIYKEHLQNLNLKQFESNGNITIEIGQLKSLNQGMHYLFECISEYGFNRSTCADIYKSLRGFSGKKFYSPTHTLLRDRKNLIITQNIKTMQQTEEYLIAFSQAEISAPIHLKLTEIKNSPDLDLKKGNGIAMVDYDRLTFPLTIRKWQEGDFFYPLGMKSKKKLSDFFIDNKLSMNDKSDIWLLCSCEEIVWVIGHRIDERYKVKPNTKNIFRMEMC